MTSRKDVALHALAREEHDRQQSTTRRQLLRAATLAGAGALSLTGATGSAAADRVGTLPVTSDDPLLKIRGDQVVLTPRTSDIASPTDGVLTFRGDESAFFDVSIAASNEPVDEGNTLTVDYSVQNTGSTLNNTQDIRLDVGSTERDRDAGVTLAGGSSTTGQLSWDSTTAGDYTATVLSDDDTATTSVSIQSGSTIPDSGVSRWTFDNADTESGSAMDVWGSNNGTINGATTGQSGLSANYDSGESYEFSRSNGDNITHPQISPSGSWSVSVLLNIDSFDDDNLYLYGVDSLNNIAFVSGSWRIRSGGNDTDIPFSNASISSAIGTSHRYTWVSDVDADVCRAYWDDGLEGSASPARQVNFDTFGNPYDTTLFNLGGNADDLRIFGKALSDTEVSDLHTTGSI